MSIRDLSKRAIGGLISLLLAVQVAFSYFPLELPPEPGTMRVVLCGPEGLQTVTIHLADGTVDTTPAKVGESRCPFCVLGFADLALSFSPPARQASYQRIAFDGVAALQAPAQFHDPARPIRAPPTVL